MTKKHKFTGPWIAFGGSYPGSMAAWLREKFPHLIAGSVSSSGPLEAKVINSYLNNQASGPLKEDELYLKEFSLLFTILCRLTFLSIYKLYMMHLKQMGQNVILNGKKRLQK